MRTDRPALKQLLRLRVVSVGAIAVLAVIGGALALPSAGHVPPGAAAVSDPDAASGGPQTPADALRGKALGGASAVSRATLERAAEQAEAIPSAGGSWEYVGANNIGGRSPTWSSIRRRSTSFSSPRRAEASGRAPTPG